MKKVKFVLLISGLLASHMLFSDRVMAESCYARRADTQGRTASDGSCLAFPIFAGNAWGKSYVAPYVMGFVTRAIQAGSAGDYNSALLHFEEASQSLLNNELISARDAEPYQREVNRGYLAAQVAKKWVDQGDSVAARQAWIEISGIDY
ncbi:MULTISPECIES: hypothetical protein [Planktothricoides]|uniref:Uncharacterized protein n=1 Tax=Planktothricoides raciborskii GIHE-MW2 TaxID=2792601 RepID=A0AAU8JHG9_9CYAN|nr:hypothetical protein [Planktothricoides sp. SR001]KOR36451.1 hypothetical protein AM228_12870 [Planktothricoides sp. SR001]